VNKLLTTEEKSSIIKNVSFSLKVEGLKPSQNTINISKKYLDNKITSEDAIQTIKSVHNIK